MELLGRLGVVYLHSEMTVRNLDGKTHSACLFEALARSLRIARALVDSTTTNGEPFFIVSPATYHSPRDKSSSSHRIWQTLRLRCPVAMHHCRRWDDSVSLEVLQIHKIPRYVMFTKRERAQNQVLNKISCNDSFALDICVQNKKMLC